MSYIDVLTELERYIEPERAKNSAWFFKTNPGGYSEGDKFLGVRVPNQRKVAKLFTDLDFAEIEKLLQSPFHEHRLTAVLLLTNKKLDQDVYEFFIDVLLNKTTLQKAPNFRASGARKGIDNWDIVDSSVHKIIGQYISENPSKFGVYDLLRSHAGLWQNRSAIVAQWWPIAKNHNFEQTFVLAKHFCEHPHDLIHKASGWMLREVGKQDKRSLTDFLENNAHQMPRTMLGYAIEHYDSSQKQYFRSL